jgi:Zn finger protein HypA/HybF involved in hydrogenase expression
VTTQADHRARRVARPWRVALVVYALALTVGTHWPALALGSDEQPSPDKLLHMLAFGGLAILLWQARWVSPPWLSVVPALVWTALDELTQGLSVLRREVSLQDMVAWGWALGPVGGVPNRMRLAFRAFIVTDLCAPLRTWILAAAAGLVGAGTVGVVAWMGLGAAGPGYGNPGNVILAAIVGAVVAALVTTAALFGPRARALAEHRPCFACGESCRQASFEDSGPGRCPSCGSSIHSGQWTAPMQLPMSAALRGAGWGVLAALGLVALGVGLYWVLLVLSMHMTFAKDVLGVWQRFAPDMRVAVDLTLVGVALATGARLYRSRQARLHDRQHLECRCCGHNLTATPVDHGLGNCPECGAHYAKIT